MAPTTTPVPRTLSTAQSSSIVTTNNIDIEQMKQAFEEMGRRVLELESREVSTKKEVKIGKVHPFSGERGTLKIFLGATPNLLF